MTYSKSANTVSFFDDTVAQCNNVIKSHRYRFVTPLEYYSWEKRPRAARVQLSHEVNGRILLGDSVKILFVFIRIT